MYNKTRLIFCTQWSIADRIAALKIEVDKPILSDKTLFLAKKQAFIAT
jgi:hypothetical protein